MGNKSKGKLKISVGDKIVFISGNYNGLTGIVTKVDFYSVDPRAIYRYLHEVDLSDGRKGFIEKGEHWVFE